MQDSVGQEQCKAVRTVQDSAGAHYRRVQDRDNVRQFRTVQGWGAVQDSAGQGQCKTVQDSAGGQCRIVQDRNSAKKFEQCAGQCRGALQQSAGHGQCKTVQDSAGWGSSAG
jgi:hypothetical protein